MPSEHRISIINPATGREWSAWGGQVYVRRWDNVVHIVESGLAAFFYMDSRGRPTGDGYHPTMVCGAKAKLHPYSRATITIEDAPTCLICLAGG